MVHALKDALTVDARAYKRTAELENYICIFHMSLSDSFGEE